jgi:integrase
VGTFLGTDPKETDKKDRLDMRQIRRLKKADFDNTTPRKQGDGANLYLVVKKRGEGLIRYLALIYDFDGKGRELSLGPATWDNLKKQRPLAAKARALLDQKPPIDPVFLWRPTIAPANSFTCAADQFIARQLRKGVWKSAKHERQWRQTLASLPRAFRDRPVNQIDAKAVYEAFAPIWDEKSETARRTLGRVREVIDFAREPEDTRPNPATLTGWLKTKLGDPSPMKRDRKTGVQIHRDNHAAMRWQDVPKLVEKLGNDGDASALALIFAILTGLRASEARKAKWDKVDFVARTLTIPWSEHKTGRKTRTDLIVPLSEAALAILRRAAAIRSGNYVFSGRLAGQPLSENMLYAALRRHESVVTVHGMRSALRTFALDEARTAFEVAEFALGHVVGDAAAQAYLRSDALERRRELVDKWGAFVYPPPDGDNVVGFRARV